MNFKRKEKKKEKITRIEVKHNSKTKTITLDHTDSVEVSNFLKEKLSKFKETIEMELPITKSPVSIITKCYVGVYSAESRSSKKKIGYKTFTTYGIDYEKLFDVVSSIIDGNS